MIPTMKKNVLLPNAKYDCDFFIHQHVRGFDELPSHPGIGESPDLNDVYEFEDVIESIAKKTGSTRDLPIVRFVESSDDDTFSRHRDLFVKTHFLKDKNGHWLYFPEVIRSWHGIELAWELMEQTQEHNGIQYDRVALLSTDAAYVTEVDIYKGRTEEPCLILSGSHRAVLYEEAKVITIHDSNKLTKARKCRRDSFHPIFSSTEKSLIN